MRRVSARNIFEYGIRINLGFAPARKFCYRFLLSKFPLVDLRSFILLLISKSFCAFGRERKKTVIDFFYSVESLSRISVDVGRAPKIEGRGQELFSDFLASRHITVRNRGAEISGRWGEGRARRGSGGGAGRSRGG